MSKARRKKELQVQELPPQETPAQPLIKGLIFQDWTVLFLLYFLAVLIYSNTFSDPFHFDDEANIVDNPRIKNLSNLIDLSGRRYVGFLSFALNYHFGQLNVFGYHLVNLLIHITNGFLVYSLVLLLLRIPPPLLTPYSSRLSPPASTFASSSSIALATALLFVVHPLQTQAVTYIVQRFTSLAALFYLLTSVLYLKWRSAKEESRIRSLYYAGALLCTVLAMKTKESSFTLPLMLLLIEAVFFESPTRKRWIALIPFLLTLLIIPLSHPGAVGEGEERIEISRWDYLFTQFRVIMTYLRLLILPVNQNLDYDYPISHSLLEPKVLFSFLFLLVLFTFSLYLLFVRPRPSHSSRLAAFGILWFFLTLSIESSIIPIRDVIFEHRLYLPSVGFFLAGSVLIITLLDRWRGMNVLVIGVLVVILSIATYQRNVVWRDDLTLWTDVVRKSPNNARGHYSLGLAYQNLEHTDFLFLNDAIREYEAAIALNPNYARAHNALGNLYKDLGRVDEQIQEYKIALTINPDFAEAHFNLGNLYKDLGRVDEQIQEYKIALTINPDFAEAHYNLGVAYVEQGRLSEAIHEFEQALQIKPDYDLARQALNSLRR